MNKKKINFRRIIEFIKPEWVLMTISLVNGLLYVIFNSISIWLTASLVNHVLIDFDQLVLDQENLLKNHDPSLNERLKIMVNDFILRETNIETLKVLCITIIMIFITKNIFLYLKISKNQLFSSFLLSFVLQSLLLYLHPPIESYPNILYHLFLYNKFLSKC